MGKVVLRNSMSDLCDLMCGFDETVAYIDCWYDRHTRLWVLQKMNKDGCQLGDAEYVYGKAGALERKKELEAKFGIREVDT